eukprot:CAMPEP_0182550306 /NCGR_PEP_ID=MMETSP1323-20130603/41427_1 /TAXON_ID=236787 /ORGANISM="Florenciella parvula, Strain RCC1693" /LENGTH=121 /DNA_ID=CAMNT_0024761825 /DNA_START=68 /DNA_END=430 /DNA_ORIENTATION=+
MLTSRLPQGRRARRRGLVPRVLLLSALIGAAASTQEGDGANLPSSAPLRVGVTRRAVESPCVGAKPGERIAVSYEARLYKSGAVIDSSIERGEEPFEFTVGAGQVLKGLDQGLLGICAGEA